MTEKGFRFCLLSMAIVLLSSSTEFPGAMIGFFCGIAVAFFVAGPTFLVASALGVDGRLILYGLIAAYAALTLFLVLMALRSWRNQTKDVARLLSIRAGLFLMMPPVFFLSSQALVRAWP